MSALMPKPYLTIETVEELRAVIDRNAREEWMKLPDMAGWHIKCTWLIVLIDEIVARGDYPYNSVVKQLAEERLGLPPRQFEREYEQEGDTLSLLIYTAQRYRDSDRLITEGYFICTEETLRTALTSKRKLMGPGTKPLTVRAVSGRLYAFEPRKRRTYMGVLGLPVKWFSSTPSS